MSLIKNNSSIFNSPSLMSNNNNISKFSLNETNIENKNNFKTELKTLFNHSRNHIINGFKNSILSLTKKKIDAIRNLYSHEESRFKPSFLSFNNIKEIDNSGSKYVKYLDNNMKYSKTPTRLGNQQFNYLKLITGKNYTSFENDKIANEMNKQRKLTRKVNVVNKKNYEFILPSDNLFSF